MSASMDRRTVLKWTISTAGAAAAASLLAACGSDDSADGAASPSASAGSGGATDFGEMSLRLAWIKNVEFSGEYLADARGYYTDEGFSSVNLITGGPTATPAETDVATGKALAGLSSPDRVGAAVAKGAKLKIIATQYQKNPFALMSMAKNPIKSPQDMIGKKIGVQAANESVWSTFIKANGLEESQLTKVPVQFDPLPLTTGTVDAWFSYITNEPNALRLKGFDVTAFLLADFNYPLVGESYVVTTESIDKDRDKLKAMLRAEIRGWKDSLTDPAAGAQLAVEKYGKDLGLTVKEQTLESKDQNALILNADTTKNGLFTMTPELIDANIKTLAVGGLDVKAADLFDMSLLEEVYEEDPSLL